MTISACGASHRGNLRGHNEDNIYVDGIFRKDISKDNILIHSKRERSPHVYAVFDGLGGEACGEQASLIAALGLRAMEDRNSSEDIDQYISTTHKTIISESVRKDARNMGTTAAAVRIMDDKATVWNVGDSRVYLFRGDELRQLSKDHSVVQSLIDNGLLKEGERSSSKYAGELTQYLGMVSEDDIEPSAYVTTEDLAPGDILMLCSDGLSGELGDEEMRRTIEDTKDRTAEFIAASLLKRAVDGECRDNASVIICKAD